MKYMFASDIHGSAYYCRKLLEAYRQSGAERLILLGDILYHGPRNDLPREYAPKEVISMLNPMKQELLAVRGNCEAEVDQMAGDILVHGHTHLLKAEKVGENYILNPGSVSIPKGGNPATYGILEETSFRILDFEGNTVKEIRLDGKPEETV